MPSSPYKCTSEQQEFLQPYLPEYGEINSTTHCYAQFWAKLLPLWDEKFPEITVVFPNKTLEELNKEERGRLGEEIAGRRRVSNQ